MKILDFRGSMYECRSRVLWQALFNLYRERGCNLDNLDNLLIDLKNCEKIIEEAVDTKKTFHIGMDRTGQTTWINGNINEDDFEWRGYDFFVKGVVDDNGTSLKVVYG